MKNWFVGICILFLGMCILASSYTDYQEWKRKEQYMWACHVELTGKWTKAPSYAKIAFCNTMYTNTGNR